MARSPTRTPQALSPRKRWLFAALLASLLAPLMVLCLSFLLMGLAHSGGRLVLHLLLLLMPGGFFLNVVPKQWVVPMLLGVQWLVCLPLCWLILGWWDRRRLPPWERDWAKH